MKTKQINLISACLLSSLFLVSCSKDDDSLNPDDPNLNYDYGFFVLNEGGSAGGSVTFVGEDLQSVQQQVFSTENPEETLGLGLYLQSIFFHEDKAYIISNGSNLITVVDRYSFELLGRIDSGLDIPRYGVAVGGKAYVTNQSSFGSTADDFVAVIDLASLEVENKIMTNAAVDYILESNGKLYIQNAAYGVGNRISVLNPQTGTVENTFTVSDGLDDIEIEGNTLYALTSTNIEAIDLASGNSLREIVFPASFVAGGLEVADGKVYVTSGKQVFSMPVDATEIPSEAMFAYESSADAGLIYGFEVENDRIFIADAGDFASDGSVHIYNEDGIFVKEIKVGIAPNGFYFNTTN